MEIKELISFYVNESLHLLEVTFRLINDNDDEIRVGQIDLDETYDFGYDFLLNDKIDNAFDDDYFDDNNDSLNDEFEEEIDEDEIIIFLNEYYTVYPKKLPKSELF